MNLPFGYRSLTERTVPLVFGFLAALFKNLSDALTVSMKDIVEKVKFPEQALSFLNAYCEILKISPEAYIFQRPFRGAYFWRG